LDGFKKFLEKHPDVKLLLHTCWSEEPSGSWDIPRLIKERGIDPSKVLSTYICPKCGNYEIRPFAGENIDCRFCGKAKCMVTTRPQIGVTEAQLNEIYNLMDVYCHPFTSGGQEMPIQEAKLTELITLVTNYSCGEEYCLPENGGFSLDWEPYYEVGTQFIKATTLPSSIFSQLEKVYKMSPIERKKMGEKARKFVIDNFSVEVIGKKWEKIIDDFPYIVNPATFKIDDYQ
jgi:glycosyltransferase involved in cell wall biosynthesis